jgi:uncharacterized protein
MIIPQDRLSHDTLQGLIEDFVTRDGTDSGYTKSSLEENVEMVMRQLSQRQAFIVYDQETQTANIVSKITSSPLHRKNDPGKLFRAVGVALTYAILKA